MTGIELVKEISCKYGYNITNTEADYIIWNHTGFPDFFIGDAESWFRNQLEELFSRPGTLIEKISAANKEYELIIPIMES